MRASHWCNPIVLPLLRLILTGVFALAGVTKLLDLRGSRQSLKDFGVPEILIPAIAIALPVAELTTAIALLPGATALYGAASAVMLLAGFTGAVGVSLLRGRRPDCHCFGQLHSQPVGWQVLARNGALLSLAVFVIVRGWPNAGAGAGDWFLSLAPVWRVVVAGVAIGLTTYAVRAIRRAQALRNAPLIPDWSSFGIPVGEPAPEFSLTGLDGGVVTLSMLRAPGKPVFLVFTDPHCGSCSELLPDIAQYQREQAGNVTVVLVSRDTPQANLAKIGELQIDRVLLQKDREVSAALGVPFTPGAVLIRADGTIGSRPVPGDGAVRKMMAELTESQNTMTMKPELGSMAPDFSLPDLEERSMTLTQLRGQATLLLFWDPRCSFCQQLLGHVRFWEARPIADRPNLLVVSRGDASVNEAQGLRAMTVLDQHFAVGPQYGVIGTPSAVLIDAEGRIASDVAVGGSAILGLIGQEDLSLLSSGTSRAESSDDGTAPALTTLPPGARPLQQDCVHDEMLADGSMVLYNGCRQQVLTLNPTAALVWEYCDGEHNVEAIVREIAGVFPTAPSPEADVRAMLDSFLQTGLIVPASNPTASPRTTS